MKKITTLLATLLSFIIVCKAQDIEQPGAYMTAISNAHKEMDQKYMAYTSAAAHGKRARKVEKLRLQVLESISNSRDKIADIPFYKGDNSLRQSNIEYINFCYTIFNEDYAKIVNTEEIAEQSFDEMQALLLLREKIDEKLKLAVSKVNQASKDFAAKYKVNLIEGKDELGEKMAQASKVSKYYKPIFLIFFKCNWQDNALTKALKDNKLNDAEQSRNSIIKYADEGLLALNAIQNFDGDASLKMACKQALIAFKTIAEKETPKITDYHLKKENFEKIKKAFEAKSQSDRTKEDVDAYNKAVNEMNSAVNISNAAAESANNKRNEAYKIWEDAVKTFYDTYVPRYR
jgi:hypothetical protein